MPTEKPSSLTLEIIKRGMLPILPAFCLIGFISGVVSYRNSLTERREKLAYQVQVMMSSLETEWVQGNYSKVARVLQQRTTADLVAFFSPDCRLLEAAPANLSLRIIDCSAAAKAFPAGVFTKVVDPTGRIGQVFVLSRLHKLKIFAVIALQILAYLLTLTFAYFFVFSNFLKNELSAKVKEIMTTGGAAPTSLYEEFEPIHRILKEYQESLAQRKAQEFKLKFEIDLGKLAAQVAHDIRSPLAALEVATGDATQLPEGKRDLIRRAVGRIQDIANNLLEKQRAVGSDADGGADSLAPGKDAALQTLFSLIESLTNEKRLQFRNRADIEIETRMDASHAGIRARVQPVEFTRLLSNLINNAVEALDDRGGKVTVGLSARDGRVLVIVQDDGKGIPGEILAKLGQRGETHGKAGGTGLGLYHARISAESWGGSLKIGSEIGKGTTMTVDLPQGPSVLANGPQGTVLIDDDPLMRMTWKMAASRAGKTFRAFPTLAEFLESAADMDRLTTVYIDADLGEGVNGAQESIRIRQLGFSKIYLATGHPASSFSGLAHLSGVVGKEPPWPDAGIRPAA